MNPDRKVEHDDEQLLAELRSTLWLEEAVPPGLVARLQAAVLYARGATDRFTVSERVVLGTLLFTTVAYFGGSAGVITGAILAIVYGGCLNALGSRTHPPLRAWVDNARQ